MAAIPQKTIHLRGFDFGTTQEQVRNHCATAGKVVSIEMKGKGSALVTYGSEAQAKKAVAKLQESTIPGNERYVEVKLKGVGPAMAAKAGQPAPGAARRLQPTAKVLPKKPLAAKPKPPPGLPPPAEGRVISVKGFDFETSEEDLRGHCATAGKVVAVELKGKDRAIVTYASGPQAQKAVTKLHESVIPGNSRYIAVKLRGPEQPTLAVPTGKRPVFVPSVGMAAPPAKKRKVGPTSACKVFIQGFDKGTTQETVRKHCGMAGSIVEFQFMKRSAIVTYGSSEQAQGAVAALAGTVIEGNTRYIDAKIDEGGAGGSQGRAAKKLKSAEKGPSGPELPRERVTDDPVAGRVLHWKGKFGWIKPEEPVQHAEASKHSGKIYVHLQDVVTGEALAQGAEVQFYVFVDASGLGAEEVMPVN